MDQFLLSNCTLCPRNCRVDRTAGQTGVCGQTDRPVVARAALHFWEEPCLSGDRGSGTVFFSGCGVGCVYCQNRSIAKGLAGKEITVRRLADIFLELQEKQAHNINLVTPGHFTPQIVEAIGIARENGLLLPIVYNCGGYEKVETLRLLEGLVDIYLPDMKYRSSQIAARYSRCGDYFEVASQAIAEMVRQVGEPVLDEEGIMRKGVIVRHLALPGCLEDSKAVIRTLFETYGNKIYISIMNQYTPMNTPEITRRYPELNRKITDEEYDELVDYALSLGVENGFIQEGETASESFIPEFNHEGV